MKAKVLTLVVPALLIAGVAQGAEVYNKNGNKLDLYGKVDGLHYFSKDRGNDGDQSYARLGIKGETQINSQLTGYGTWEEQFDANVPESGSSMKLRYGYAGLRYGELGSLDYGRNTGVVYDVTSFTDMLPEFGGDTYSTENFMQSRIAGALTYRNNDFFGLISGLNFALQYQGKTNFSDVLKQNGDGFGAALTYNLGWGVTVGGALASYSRTNAQNNMADTHLLGKGDRAEVYTVGLKYDANNIYFGVHYKQAYNATKFGNSSKTGANDIYGYANKASNFETVLQYTFDFGLVPSLAYLESRGHDIEGYGDQDILKYADVGATYYFNKNMSTYVDYKINLLKDNKFTRNAHISTDNIVGVGLVYQF